MEDVNHLNLAVLLTLVDLKKPLKFGSESVLYAIVTVALQYSLAGGQGMVSSNTSSECKSLWGEPERVHRNMKQNIQATESTYAQHN